jgi:hypothetical protein
MSCATVTFFGLTDFAARHIHAKPAPTSKTATSLFAACSERLKILRKEPLMYSMMSATRPGSVYTGSSNWPDST